jgi:hypothetical protein
VLVAKEERTVGTFIDDTVIAARLKNLYFNNNEKIFFNVDVEVNEGRVLLTGTVETSDIRIEATKLAWGISDVVTVINEIQISDNDNILDYADDLVITTKINAKLLKNKEINNLNSHRFYNENYGSIPTVRNEFSEVKYNNISKNSLYEKENSNINTDMKYREYDMKISDLKDKVNNMESNLILRYERLLDK